jgi:hypothetical protein
MIARMGIKDGEIEWPKHLPDVQGVTDDGVADTRSERQLFHCSDWSALRGDGGEA